MKIFYLMLLVLSSLSYAHGSSEEGHPSYGVEPTEDQLKPARKTDFCVCLAKKYDPKVIDLGRPFVEEFLNPATVDGHGNSLFHENLDLATIIFNTITLALERENEGVLDVLSPVFKSDASPRVKAETARLVTTLPIGDQEGFVTLWKDFYEKNAHPDVHEKIVKCVGESEGIREEKDRDRDRRAALMQNACPLETFLIGLSKALFLFPEDQRLGKTMGLLGQYPTITRPVDIVNYVMKEGDIDKELHRILTFLGSCRNNELEAEMDLMDVVWWIAAVRPILTIKDLQDIEGEMRKALDANKGVIGGILFNVTLRGPYLKWKDEHEKESRRVEEKMVDCW